MTSDRPTDTDKACLYIIFCCEIFAYIYVLSLCFFKTIRRLTSQPAQQRTGKSIKAY